MDVNGTRFHLLLGRCDWGRCRDEKGDLLGARWAMRAQVDVAYDDQREELVLQPQPFRFRPQGAPTSPPSPPEPSSVLDISARRGAARDRYGNWYWIDAVPVAILVNSAGTGATSRFWSSSDGTARRHGGRGASFEPVAAPAPPPPLRLAGAAVTEDHYLVVGVVEPPGLLVFDLQAGGPPEQVAWPPGVPFSPFDLAARDGGGAYVLDREHRRYWELDRHLLVVSRRVPEASPSQPHVFAPRDGEAASPAARVSFAPPALEDAVDLNGMGADPEAPGPVAIEATAEGTVLVLFRDDPVGPSAIRPYRDGQPLRPAEPTTDMDLAVTGHDMALDRTPDPRHPDLIGRLFVVDASGDQAFEFSLHMNPVRLELSAVERCYPMRLFGGKALVAAEGRAYYDFADRWIPLVEQRRQRFHGRGVVVTDVLDGREPRVCLAPAAARRLLAPRDRHEGVQRGRRRRAGAPPVPAVGAGAPLYPRADGSEQPFVLPHPAGDYQTWELLFQQARDGISG